MANVLVKNASPNKNIIIIGGPGHTGDASTYRRLIPGWNEVEYDIWNATKASLKFEIDNGILIVKEATTEVAPEKQGGKASTVVSPVALKDLTAKERTTIIEGTFDLTQLEAWKYSEGTTEALRMEIMKRIDELMKEPKN